MEWSLLLVESREREIERKEKRRTERERERERRRDLMASDFSMLSDSIASTSPFFSRPLNPDLLPSFHHQQQASTPRSPARTSTTASRPPRPQERLLCPLRRSPSSAKGPSWPPTSLPWVGNTSSPRSASRPFTRRTSPPCSAGWASTTWSWRASRPPTASAPRPLTL